MIDFDLTGKIKICSDISILVLSDRSNNPGSSVTGRLKEYIDYIAFHNSTISFIRQK